MKLSEHQLGHLVRLGLAVDELEFRGEAARRVIEATRDALRTQKQRAAAIGVQLQDLALRHGVQRGDQEAIATAAKLTAERETVTRQVAALDRQLEDAHAKSQSQTRYFAPLRSTFERLVARSGFSAADLGIPRGEAVARNVRPDVVIGAGQ